MDVQAVLGILGLAAAVFSTFWATGGWSALRRRSIQQELNLAKELPESSTKKKLTDHAENQIAIYLYRIQDKPAEVGRPLSISAMAFIIVALITAVFRHPPNFVEYIFEGLLAVVLLWTYATLVRSGWIWWNRRRHKRLLQAAREAGDPTRPG